MTSQQTDTEKECVFVLCMCECESVHVGLRVSVIRYRADENETSVPAAHHSARRLLYLLPESPCATDKCARARTNSVKSACVSLTVGVGVVTLGRGVSCVTNGNPDHSLWISYLLQSYKEGEKSEKRDKDRDIFRRCSRLWFPWQSHASPHSSSSKAQKQNSK